MKRRVEDSKRYIKGIYDTRTTRRSLIRIDQETTRMLQTNDNNRNLTVTSIDEVLILTLPGPRYYELSMHWFASENPRFFKRYYCSVPDTRRRRQSVHQHWRTCGNIALWSSVDLLSLKIQLALWGKARITKAQPASGSVNRRPIKQSVSVCMKPQTAATTV